MEICVSASVKGMVIQHVTSLAHMLATKILVFVATLTILLSTECEVQANLRECTQGNTLGQSLPCFASQSLIMLS